MAASSTAASAAWRARVEAVERAYVALAVGGGAAAGGAPGDAVEAVAALGAVASRFLAVGTPRTLGVIATPAFGEAAARACVDAHAVWFAPREVRVALVDAADLGNAAPGAPSGVAGALEGEPPRPARPAAVAAALGADVVCVLAPLVVTLHDLRRGTHVNLLGLGAAAGALDPALAARAVVVDERAGATTLAELAAGLKDGRQLDELTVFRVGDAGAARAALAALATDDAAG